MNVQDLNVIHLRAVYKEKSLFFFLLGLTAVQDQPVACTLSVRCSKSTLSDMTPAAVVLVSTATSQRY